MSFSLALTGCKSTSKDASHNDSNIPPKETNSPDLLNTTATDELNALCNEIFVELVSNDALSLNYMLCEPSAYNITDYPTVMINFDSNDYNIHLEEIKEYQDKLYAIDYDSLSYEQKITYDTLVYYLDSFYKGVGYELYAQPLGPTIGVQAELPITLCEYSFYTKEDIDRYLTALPSVYDTFSEIMKFEKKKSDAGLFMNDTCVDNIIAQCEDFIKDIDNNFLITSFNTKINNYEGLSALEKKNYIKKNALIVKNKIIPAYQLMIDELKKLKGTGTNQGGLCNFKDGKNYYNYLILSQVGDNVNATKVKKLLETSIKKNLANLYKIYIKYPDLDKSVNELSKNVSSNSNIDNADSSATQASHIIKELSQDILNDYPSIDNIDYSLKKIDASLEKYVSPAMYYKPPVDSKEINSIYINEAAKSDSISFFTVLSHEGFPGHMYQYNYEKNNDNSALRQALSITGASEGWAEYVQFKSYQYIDSLDDNVANVLAINARIGMYIEAVADIGVNYEGWTVDDVYNYINQYFTIDNNLANEVFQSVIEAPANTLCYAYGSAFFEQLEQNARKKKGDKFNELEFNTFLLDVGFTYFPILQNRFNTNY